MTPKKERLSPTSNIRLSVANPLLLVDMLKEKGFSRRDIFIGLGINPDLLEDPENVISYKQYSDLISRAIELTDNPAIGLEFGARMNVTGTGLLGMGALASNTFLEALHFSKRMLTVLNPAVAFSLTSDHEYAHLDVEEALSWYSNDQFMVDTAFATFATTIKILDGRVGEQVHYKFRHKALQNEPLYLKVLQGHLTFEWSANRMSIPIEFCKRPMPFQNPTAVRNAEDWLARKSETLKNARTEIVVPIQQLIEKQQGRLPSIAEAAQLFRVSPRTLNRRLNAIGTNFQEILTDVKKKIAVGYLENPEFSVEEIASRLGYSDPSNFSKAFREWTGHSPTSYRMTFFAD